MTAEEVYTKVLAWSEKYDKELYEMLSSDKEYAVNILSIGRGGAKPRKDLTVWTDVKPYIELFYDDHFEIKDAIPENFSKEDIKNILSDFVSVYDNNDGQDVWFEKIKEISEKNGFCKDVKQFKKDPGDYKGHVGDVSMFLRIAVTGKMNSPDMYEVMKLLGGDKVIARIKTYTDSI